MVEKVEDAEKMVFPENVVVPENVLLLARSVEDAAVTVIPLPTEKVVPLTVPSDPVRRLVLREVVAITSPFWSVASTRDAVTPVK